MESPILMGPSGIGGNFGAAEVAGDELAVVADFAVFAELLHDATIRTPLAASAPNVTYRRCVRTGPPCLLRTAEGSLGGRALPQAPVGATGLRAAQYTAESTAVPS